MLSYVKLMREKIGNSPLLLVAAGVIVYQNGKILLQRRADTGNWAIHGGCLELGEAAEETAIREIKEELGIVPLALEFYGVFSGEKLHYVYPNGDEVYLVSVVYFCESFTGEINIDETEVKEVKWFDVRELPAEINSPVDNTILQGLGGFIRKTNREWEK